MPFDSPDVNLALLLGLVADGKMQLPDFQREWKWDDPHISSLLASISLGHPVGVLMSLQTGDTATFAPQPISGVSLPTASAPEELLLDGQQRVTSLYQSLLSGRPVETCDPRGKKLKRWYFLDIATALDPEADREDAIVSVPDDMKLRDNFGRDVIADYSSVDLQCEAERFPLSIVFDGHAKDRWMVTYLKVDEGDMPRRLERWSTFQEGVLANFTSYAVPVIRLHKETPKEAVCTVFEKVNTGGVPLNVFELLTATFASDNYRLKDDWDQRQRSLRDYRVLRTLESADFLQAVSLLATYERRRAHYARGGDATQAPGVSCKRKDVLRLGLDEYITWADKAQEGFEWAARFLSQQHMFQAADLPYRTQLVPFAAIRAVLGKDADTHGATAKLSQWLWCGILGELYGGAVETRFARDLEQCVEWVRGDGELPGTVQQASFREPRLHTLRTRNSAAYKGLFALLMKHGACDWIRNETMDMSNFFELKVDIHHVFPKDWCIKNQIADGMRESIVNKTPLSYSTNRTIAGRSPAQYVATLANKAEIPDAELDAIIATHAINPLHLRETDFAAYFSQRTSSLLELIADAMKKNPILDDTTFEGDESAFVEEYEDVQDGDIQEELIAS